MATWLANAVLWGLETLINLLVVAVAALIAVLLALLPSMPAAPTVASSGWISWLNWFIPVSGIATAFAAFVTAWVLFLVIRIPLRWVKGL